LFRRGTEPGLISAAANGGKVRTARVNGEADSSSRISPAGTAEKSSHSLMEVAAEAGSSPLTLRAPPAHAGTPEHRSPPGVKFGSGSFDPARDSRAKALSDFASGVPNNSVGVGVVCRLSIEDLDAQRPLLQEIRLALQGVLHDDTGAEPGSVCCWRIADWPRTFFNSRRTASRSSLCLRMPGVPACACSAHANSR
jgi:hypothetical protein